MKGTGKVGLDDFLVKHGAAALETLKREPFDTAQALWELNDTFAYIQHPSVFLDVPERVLLSVGQFVLRTAPLFHMLPSHTAQNTRPQRVNSGREWIKWKARRTYTRLAYEPGQPEDMANGSFNTWRKPSVVPVKPPARVLKMYHTFIAYLFANEPQVIEWFHQWVAYPLQHPGTKMYSALLLHGPRQGTGKSLLGELIGACYGENFKIVERDQIYQPFNSWVLNTQFVLGDEITGSDRRREADSLNLGGHPKPASDGHL